MLLWALVGGVLICVVLLDAFETIVLPRRVARRLRLAYDGFLGHLGIARTPEVAHAVEVLNAVCTSPEHE
jgi:hypothetical protein